MPASAPPPTAPVAKGVSMPSAAYHLADRDMTCAAGFYRTGDSATAAVWQLQMDLGLDLSQVTVVSPAALARGSLAASAARWRNGRALADTAGRPGPRLGAVAGGLLGALPLLAWAAAPAPPGMVLERLVAVALGGAVGALLGALLALLAAGRPGGHRFDDTVQRQLGRGHHAVVVHGVPAAQQAEALALLRRTGLRWCAEAPRSARRRLGATQAHADAR